jgi:hypothetical protein
VSAPVRLALVGHTNTGKTSLVRTLSRDAGFGEVSSRPGTTRHVEGVRLLVDGRALIELYDTPGLEDPIALLERLDTLAGDQRLDGPSRIAGFLSRPEATGRFEQEAKVLRQLGASDAALYIIDARDPVLDKHRDELEILSLCGIPLLPVLNFVASPSARPEPWRTMLSRLGLHAVVEFDAVAPERQAEPVLYRKLAVLLDKHRDTLETLIAGREREALARRHSALIEIATLLIDAAAVRRWVRSEPEAERQAEVRALADDLRAREARCRRALLALYRFSEQTVESAELPPLQGRWQSDLFAPEALPEMGIRLASGAATGAAAGLGVDLMVGGISLGAVIGGGWQTVRRYGESIKGKLTGRLSLTVDEAIIRLLALRQLSLLAALDARGHGAIAPVVLPSETADPWRDRRLPAPLRQARTRPDWSALTISNGEPSGRDEAIARLAQALDDGHRSE